MALWERIRHRAAIAGRVTDAQTNQAIAGATVEIVQAPEAFNRSLKSRSSSQTQTAYDGHFHFLDLPEGDYQLTAALPGASRRYGTASVTVNVSPAPEDRTVIAEADLALPPTCLKGEVVDQDGDPVVLAEVRLKYSEEKVFSNQAGQYLLSGIEASEKIERTVMISAQGHQSTFATVTLSQPGIEKTVDFVLQKQSKNL